MKVPPVFTNIYHLLQKSGYKSVNFPVMTANIFPLVYRCIVNIQNKLKLTKNCSRFC